MREAQWHPILERLLTYLTEERQQRLLEALQNRTRFLTVALEDLFHPHNSNAVVRSAECFGLQDLYVVENIYDFQTSKGVNKGSSKWVDIHRFNEAQTDNISNCIQHLKHKGYRVAAASPHATSVNLSELPLDQPLALIFGREKLGLSKQALEQSDLQFHIPMYGLTESFNISVSAAICMHHLSERIRNSASDHWSLSAKEKQMLLYRWLQKSIRGFEKIELKLQAEGVPVFNEADL